MHVTLALLKRNDMAIPSYTNNSHVLVQGVM